MSVIGHMMQVVDIHVTRINFALQRLEGIFPLDANGVTHLGEQQMLLIELLASRFAKLQDIIGRKVVDAYLDHHGELMDNLTMIDKINKLERQGIIDHVDIWQRLRVVRNHLAHEYPDLPAMTAKHLNQLYDITPELLTICQRIQARL